MIRSVLLRRLSFVLLCLLTAGASSAQNPITWDAPYSCSGWSPTFSANSIINPSPTGGPYSPCGAPARNVLSACRPSGYVTGKLIVTTTSPFGWDETVMLALDDSGVISYPNRMDYAFTLTYSPASGTYTLRAGLSCDPSTLTLLTTLYSATITPASGDVYRISRNGSSVYFYRNATLLASTSWSGQKLKVVALLLPNTSAGITEINTDFGMIDLCGNPADDNDWKGAGTGTLSPFNTDDNVYVPARIGIGIASPAEKLEVGGRVRITAIDADNTLTRMLVADATGVVKYRDITTMPAPLDWRTTAGAVPASLNDQIYKNGRVGLNTSTVNATLHVVNGTCDNVPAFRVSDASCDVSCNAPNSNGDLVYVEHCNGLSGFLPSLVVKQSGAVGIGTASPGAYKLYVNGNTYTSGTYSSSDRRFKNNIVRLQDAMKLISSLEGVRYSFRNDIFYPRPEGDKDGPVRRSFPEGPQIGLIAQDVEKVLPEVVQTDKDGYKAIAYQNIVALLIEGLKEQAQTIEALERRLEAVEAGKTTGSGATRVTDAPASADVSWLGQSIPNPAGSDASITYHLAGNTSRASIVLYTGDGVVVKRFGLATGRRDDRITINVAELQSGIYVYSLITDGGIVDTKKMTVVR